MIITLNGAQAEVPDGTSLHGLLVRGGHQIPEQGGRGIAIAMNGAVVPRGHWTYQQVCEGDVIELLTATQGG